MNRCEDCGQELCRECSSHYCCEPCPCARSHSCDCACRTYDKYLTNAD